MTNQDIIDLGAKHLFQIYARAPLALVRGEGCRVWDGDGKEYLDFFSSTVVVNLGHCHPNVTRAISEQAKTIVHVSNLHHSLPQAQLAERLCAQSFADRVFFCNSGAEANEAAIKLARKFGADFGDGRFEIITAIGSFHGRTIATITATGQEKVRRGFQPLPEGFRYVPYNDVDALSAAISDRTIAIMLEPMLGEGGVLAPAPSYLEHVRDLCDRRGLVLILDEVQTGMGRLGRLFGYELSGITPDIMTLGKGIANGVPLGAMLATERVAQAFGVGAHGTTFGGNALACAAGIAVFDTLVNEGVVKNCHAMGEYLRERLRTLQQSLPIIRDIRGHGLLIGIELAEAGAAIVDRCRTAGLIINCTADKVLRLSPPLIVSRSDVDRAVTIIEQALRT